MFVVPFNFVWNDRFSNLCVLVLSRLRASVTYFRLRRFVVSCSSFIACLVSVNVVSAKCYCVASPGDTLLWIKVKTLSVVAVMVSFVTI